MPGSKAVKGRIERLICYGSGTSAMPRIAPEPRVFMTDFLVVNGFPRALRRGFAGYGIVTRSR
jgi:hypothetical protein